MNIEYNADSIRSLNISEAFQLRPKLYFQDYFDKKYLNELIFEALCHAFDEYFDGNCSEIILTLEATNCSIQYNTGMSLALKHDKTTHAEAIMTKMYTCSNLKKHLEVGEEFCKLGMAAVNAACTNCQLNTTWEGQQANFHFEHGKTIKKTIEPTDKADSWTRIKLQPDPMIFGDLTFESNSLYTKLQQLDARLKGLKFTIQDLIN